MKDQELTKKELTALCRKQEEYIKELEEKLKTPSDTEKCCEPRPDYVELYREVQNLRYILGEEKNTNDALKCSLKMMYKEMNDWKNWSNSWQENYYTEHNRAEKLFDELEKLNRESSQNGGTTSKCKALKIIEKKCLTNCNLALVKDNATYEGYCKEFEYFLEKYNESPNGFEITKEDLLTQDEYNLLKEVLKK